jgi:hypothetical protein
MSIQTVEIALPTGIDSVSVGLAEPISIVEVRQGPAGPSVIDSSTTSDGTADLDLSNVTTETATVTGTLTANHIHGNLAGNVYGHVRAGEALEKGDPVYVSSSFGSGSTLIPIVSKADASNAAKMPAIGIMDADLANNATGHMVIVGTITELDTDGLTVNAELYVAAGGGMTGTPPTARAQPVARVERVNANNGAVIVKVNGLSASDATGSTLVRRTSTGAAAFGQLTASSALATHSLTGSISLVGTGSQSLSASYAGGATIAAATSSVTMGGGNLTLSTSNQTQVSGTTFVVSTSSGMIVSGLVEQRDGLNSRETRIYGTYSGAGADYRRLALKMSNTGVAQIVAEGAGTGALLNRIEIDGLRIGKGRGDVATNTAVGFEALNVNTTGSNNLAVGYQSLIVNTTGNGNCAVGTSALFRNTTGGDNTALGLFALFDSVSSSENTALGSRALQVNTGASNTAVGYQSLVSNTTGTNNSAIGGRSGRFIADGTTVNAVTTSSVYIGSETKALASGQTNQIVIGHQAIGIGSNTAVLGNDSIVTTALKGNVGIGTTSPSAKLDVNSDTVRVRTARTPASATAGGNAGDICWDADYIYVCTATNTWKRTAISTWP